MMYNIDIMSILKPIWTYQTHTTEYNTRGSNRLPPNYIGDQRQTGTVIKPFYIYIYQEYKMP